MPDPKQESKKKAKEKDPLQVSLSALKLVTHTLTCTHNEKIFTPKYYHEITAKLNYLATQIYVDIWTANNIKVRKDNIQYRREDRNERLKLQERAIRNCNNLMAMLIIAQKMFKFPSRRLEYWTKLILDVRNPLRKWHDSDADRYRFKEDDNLFEKYTAVETMDALLTYFNSIKDKMLDDAEDSKEHELISTENK